MTIANRELFGVVSGGAGKESTRLTFWPGGSGMPRLDNIANTFELWRLRKFKVSYATSSGTTEHGMVIFSIDFDTNDAPTTLSQIQAQVPNARVSIWQAGSITLSGQHLSKVNKTSWLYTKAGGATHPGIDAGFSVNAWNTGPNAAGELYADYEVELSNPTSTTTTAPSASFSQIANPMVQIRGSPGSTFVPSILDNANGRTIFNEAAIMGTVQSLVSRYVIQALANTATVPGYLNGEGSSSPEPTFSGEDTATTSQSI
jgi:hypothetical protein